MNLLLAIESFYDGGAEVFAIRLANELSKRHQVYFLELYPFKSIEKKQKKLIQETVRLIQPDDALRLRCLAGLARIIRWRPVRRRIDRLRAGVKRNVVLSMLKQKDIGVVHSNSWQTDVFFSELKKKTRFRLISTWHGHYELEKQRHMNGFDETSKEALKRIDYVAYLSQSHYNELKRLHFDMSKTKKIWNGIDTQKPLSTNTKKNRELKVCIVSRAIPEKGWKEAILAVTQINDKDIKVTLDLVGDGECLGTLMNEFDDLSYITFWGYQEDVLRFIRSSDVCLLPSYYPAESLPYSIIEYLACGKPVIATDIGSIKDMLTANDKVAGQLLELKGQKISVADIKTAIEKYLQQEGLIEEHATYAASAFDKFDIVTCADHYERIYAS